MWQGVRSGIVETADHGETEMAVKWYDGQDELGGRGGGKETAQKGSRAAMNAIQEGLRATVKWQRKIHRGQP